MPLPSATTTIQLASQDVQIWFDQLSPLLVLLGIPVAVAILGIIVYVIIMAFHKLENIFKSDNKPHSGLK